MSIEITQRHTSLPKELRDYAQKKAEKLEAAFPRVEYIHVILDEQKHQHLCELVVQAKNHIRIEADASDEDTMACIDQAVKKAERQLRDLRNKAQEHKNISVSEFERIVASEEPES